MDILRPAHKEIAKYSSRHSKQLSIGGTAIAAYLLINQCPQKE